MNTPSIVPSLTVIVPLSPELARTIDTLARQRGQSREQFISGFLHEHLDRSAPSFDEVTAPLAEDFRRGGMTEDELEALIEEERQALWNEKHS
ncbi:MAG: CopG family transcriptional regulator [Isosphaeraceae bacterium]